MRNYGTFFIASASALVALTMSPASANAADEDAARAAWGTAAAEAGANAPSTLVAKGTVRTTTTKIRRGSVLMWAEERVEFRWDGSKVVSSSGFQKSGAVAPNFAKKLGTKKIVTTTSKHGWRGGYKVGAGVPTPWGTVEAWSRTDYVRTDVKKNGSWKAWWQ